MWSDNDIDNAFQRLNPPEPEPASFPLDAWLRLETQLDKAVIERTVRHRLWRYFAAEVAVVALVVLGWLLWPTQLAPTNAGAIATSATIGGPAGSSTAQTNMYLSDSQLILSNPAGSGVAAPITHPVAGTTIATAAHPTASTPVAPAVAIQPEALAITVLPARQWLSALLFNAPRQQARAGQQQESRLSRVALANGRIIPNERSQGISTTITPTVYPATEARRNQAIARAEVATNDAAISAAASQQAVASAANWRFTNAQNRAGHPATRSQMASRFAAAPAFSAVPTIGGMSENTSVESLVAMPGWPVALLLEPRPELPAAFVPVAVAAAPVLAPHPPARLYLGLVVAPDVSTVKFANVQSPLPNVGLTVEYRLTNRLRLSTGVLRSTKHYTAHREDYDWGDYSDRVYQHDFRDLTGSCTVLDVPLNLRYDVIIKPQYRLFGSAGLSSYFMQREQYSYDWVENNTLKRWSRSVVNENRHVLSIFNLSIGYERSLTSHWSLQAEPYLKLPLSGVGAGSVRLTSAGVFVGAKYGF